MANKHFFFFYYLKHPPIVPVNLYLSQTKLKLKQKLPLSIDCPLLSLDKDDGFCPLSEELFYVRRMVVPTHVYTMLKGHFKVTLNC